MTLLTKATSGFSSLERLAEGDSSIHKLNPLIKTIATFVYVVIVVSFGRYQVSSMLPFIFFPMVVLLIGEIPIRPLISRIAITLPFCIFAGSANIFFDRITFVELAGISISYGMVSFVSILIKVILTVFAVLILIATTTMPTLSRQLIRLRIPSIFVLLINMIYRYISVALEETVNMYTAYTLRAPTNKGISIKDMGTFVGQLLLRSFDRGERVYFAMKCRGFNGNYKYMPTPKPNVLQWMGTIIFTLCLILLRMFNLPNYIGNLF